MYIQGNNGNQYQQKIKSDKEARVESLIHNKKFRLRLLRYSPNSRLVNRFPSNIPLYKRNGEQYTGADYIADNMLLLTINSDCFKSLFTQIALNFNDGIKKFFSEPLVLINKSNIQYFLNLRHFFHSIETIEYDGGLPMLGAGG